MTTPNPRPTPRADGSLPTKPPAPAAGRRARAVDSPPTTTGSAKTDRPPKRALRKASSKPAFDPHDVQPGPQGELGDQEPRRARRAAARGTRGQPEQYVRMRMRVRDDGRLRVADAHLVDGPLGQATSLAGTNVYEVSLGDRLLHAGSLPDLGVQRSFVNPAGPQEERGHHLAERPVVEFMARVPAQELTAETIGQISVRLHRVKEQVVGARAGAARSEAFDRQVRPIAELVGLPASVLPEEIEARGGRTAQAPTP